MSGETACIIIRRWGRRVPRRLRRVSLWMGICLCLGCQQDQSVTPPAQAPMQIAAATQPQALEGASSPPPVSVTLGPAPGPSPPRPGPAGPSPYSRVRSPAAHMKLEPNVVRVAAFYAPYNPWIWTEDRSRVRGIVISALYLEGSDVLGVFGDGIIRPRLYVLEKDDQGRKVPRLVREWAFDPEQALPFRAKNQTAMGWGYSFRLVWDRELDLAGQEIRMIVTFERRDGGLVHSSKKDFRVPGGGG